MHISRLDRRSSTKEQVQKRMHFSLSRARRHQDLNIDGRTTCGGQGLLCWAPGGGTTFTAAAANPVFLMFAEYNHVVRIPPRGIN
jgi:hypothetical protein